MRKPIVFAIVIGVLVGGLGVGTYLLMKKIRGGQPAVTIESEQSQARLLNWEDPAGFTFQYPEGLSIDKHDEDKKNYAHIEMTHPDYPGRLIVWAKDTTAADIVAWVKTEQSFRDASVVDTTLGAEQAKKILITAPTNKIIIGTIFDEIVWYIETEPDEGNYWQTTLDTIVSSFTFIPLPGESSSNQEASGYEEVAVDEEEIIE